MPKPSPNDIKRARRRRMQLRARKSRMTRHAPKIDSMFKLPQSGERYIRYTDGSIRRQKPKPKGRPAKKATKRERQRARFGNQR